MSLLHITRIDIANGHKFDSIEVDRTIRPQQLNRFRHLVSYFISRKLGKQVDVLLTYRDLRR